MMTAWIDGSCDAPLADQLRAHTSNCPSCAAFYQEQQRLTRLLRSPELELEPPAWVWTRISSELRPAPQASSTGFWEDLLSVFRMQSLRYAALAILCVILISVGLLQIGGSDRSDDLMLAQLQAYQIETHGNPFQPIPAAGTADNPFLSFESIDENPFAGNRSLK